MSKNKKVSSNIIANNRRARHEYSLENEIEAGMVLEGWEIKSIRQGKVQIAESHVMVQKGEVFLFGANITPLSSVSTHIKAKPQRARKLLLNGHEISHLVGSVERKGYTIVPLSLYWKKNRVKCKIAMAKGKQLHDKRASEKQRDWEREKNRIFSGY